MANPSEAWEQAQGRHVNQKHGVIGLLREASRTASIPGEDQNGFSNRAVEEGTRTFFQAVDSIKFEQKTGKASFVLPRIKSEDDEDSEMQIYSADMKDGSMDDRRDNTIQNDGSLSIGGYDSDINGWESDHGGSVSVGRTTSPTMNTDNPETLQNPIRTPIKIARTQQRASAAMGPRIGGADGLSSHEPQRVSSSTGVFIKGEHSDDHSLSRAGQVTNLLLDQAVNSEVSSDDADIVPDITRLQKLLADLKVTAENGGFGNRAEFIRVFKAGAGQVFVGRARPCIARLPAMNAQSSKRKRRVMEMKGQGKRDHGAKISESAARSPEQGDDLEDGSDELRVIPRDEFISGQSEQVPDSPDSSHGASNDDQDNFRTGMLKCKTMEELIDWMNTIKSQSIGYYNAVIDNVEEISKAKSRIAPSEPFPNHGVLQWALEAAREYCCGVQHTWPWLYWQTSMPAGCA